MKNQTTAVSYRDRLKLLTGAAGLAMLSACGGGNSSSTPPPSGGTPPPPPVPPTPPPTTETPVDGLLRDTFRNNFVVGAAVGPAQIGRTDDSDVLAKQFSSLTAENVMKPEALAPTEGNYTFEEADALVSFAETNGLQVRGHTLLWHRATPSYFFEGTRDEIKARLQQYVTDVVTHFRGKIYAWDVVNEVISDDDGSTAPYRDSNWYQAAGGPDYIDWAFEAARAADPDVKLFINDYNTELSGKRGRYLEVITDLISRNIPLDGVGHQMHLHVETPLENALAAIDAIDDSFLGLDQHVTELDISLYNDPGSCWNTQTNCQADYNGNVPEDIVTQQAELYRGLFNGFAERPSVTSVTTWGVSDAQSWLNGLPITRINAPLLWDRSRDAKASLQAILDPEFTP